MQQSKRIRGDRTKRPTAVEHACHESDPDLFTGLQKTVAGSSERAHVVGANTMVMTAVTRENNNRYRRAVECFE